VGVERQVVGGERDVVLEQRAQALREHGRQARRQEVEEQPVVHEHELGALRDGPLHQLPLGGDAGHDPAHLLRSGHLEAVRAEVLERARFEQLVESGDDRGDSRHGNGHKAVCRRRPVK
jgi:hypothetical protein